METSGILGLNELKWFRQNKLKQVKGELTVGSQYIYYDPYSRSSSSYKVVQYLGEITKIDTGFNGNFSYTAHKFKNGDGAELSIRDSRDSGRGGIISENIYEFPTREEMESFLPPSTPPPGITIPSQQQLDWFRGPGPKPEYEPESTNIYYLDVVPKSQISEKNYYIVLKDRWVQKYDVGYLFNTYTYTKNFGQSQGGVKDNTELRTVLEFAVGSEVVKFEISQYDNDKNVFKIPDNLPENPPPPKLTSLYRRIVSIVLKDDTFTISFHDGFLYTIDIGKIDYSKDKYIEVTNVPRLTFASRDLKSLLYNDYTKLTGTFNIEGACAGTGQQAVTKELYMEFYIGEDKTPRTKITLGHINDDPQFKKVRDATQNLTSKDLQGLCFSLDKRVSGPPLDKLKEITEDPILEKSESAKDVFQLDTYIDVGGIACKVKISSYSPQRIDTGYNYQYGESSGDHIVPNELTCASLITGKNVTIRGVRIFMTIEEYDVLKSDTEEHPQQESYIYVKEITPTNIGENIGKTVYFYPNDDTTYNHQQGILLKKQKDGKYVVQVSAKNNTVVDKVYEKDKSKSGGGRRRKTRNISKKKQTYNKRGSRSKKSVKTRYSNKRRRTKRIRRYKR